MPSLADRPKIKNAIPIMYEDEGTEMGESWPHASTEAILRFAMMSHFEERSDPATVLSNMNLYYHPKDWASYVSPDVMVVPVEGLPHDLTSYSLKKTGPAPFLTVEVLSDRTWQEGDLTMKPDVYSRIGVEEYLLVDVGGDFLEEKLILKTRSGKDWVDQSDEGQGIVSKYGFRVIIDKDDRVRVLSATDGDRYPRPEEARQHQIEARTFQKEAQDFQKQNQHLLAEIARLKTLLPPNTGPS